MRGECLRQVLPAHQSVVGWHQGAVMRNTTPRGGESRCTPFDEPVRTLVAGGGGGGQSVLGWDGAAIYSYDTGALRPLSEPLPTQTTVEGDALLTPGVDVDDCTLRMLAVGEIKDGMAFIPRFHLLTPSSFVSITSPQVRITTFPST